MSKLEMGGKAFFAALGRIGAEAHESADKLADRASIIWSYKMTD